MPLNSLRSASRWISFDNGPAQSHVVGCNLELRGLKRDRRFEYAVNAAAQDASVRAGHADVALKGSAARKNLLVCGRHMRMRAEHRRHAAVEIATHELFVARRFGMKI